MKRGTAVLDRLTFIARHLSRHSPVDHGILIFISRSHWHMLNSFKLREMYGSTHQSWTPGKLMKMLDKSEAILISGAGNTWNGMTLLRVFHFATISIF